VNLLTLCYLIGSITFILGLKMLSHPESARKGNALAALGMAISILGTIFLYEESGKKLDHLPWIFAALVLGTVMGWLAAKKVQMTAMPEMVSLFNGMGGACAALISIMAGVIIITVSIQKGAISHFVCMESDDSHIAIHSIGKDPWEM